MPESDNQNRNSNTFQNPADNDEMVSFAVMPHSNDDYSDVKKSAPQKMVDIAPHHSIWQSKTTYMVVGGLVLITLGALAYFLLWADNSNSKEPENHPATRLPDAFLQRYWNSTTCVDQAKCGDSADPDQDGLQNYDEFKEQTDPTLPDSDNDGLADGDELNVYLTDPIKKYTDPRTTAAQNNFLDGLQIKNNYDPLTPGLKLTEVRLEQIATNTAKYGLHEPTVTTLKAAVPEAKTFNVSIVNGKFDAAQIKIKVNDTVVWLNKDATPHQIASDPHPAHTNLPELASGSLATNQTYSFKFTESGTFTYHDHLNPAIKGTVTVEE